MHDLKVIIKRPSRGSSDQLHSDDSIGWAIVSMELLVDLFTGHSTSSFARPRMPLLFVLFVKIQEPTLYWLLGGKSI